VAEAEDLRGHPDHREAVVEAEDLQGHPDHQEAEAADLQGHLDPQEEERQQQAAVASATASTRDRCHA
jgi:hypothetical protein